MIPKTELLKDVEQLKQQIIDLNYSNAIITTLDLAIKLKQIK